MSLKITQGQFDLTIQRIPKLDEIHEATKVSKTAQNKKYPIIIITDIFFVF